MLKATSGDADMTGVDDRRPPEVHGLAASIGVYHAIEGFHRGDELAMPALPDEVGLTTVSKVVVEPVAEAPPAGPDADSESIEAIKARLAARGLLVKGPAIVVPKEPRPDQPVLLDDVLAEAEGDLHPNAVPEDDWDVTSEGGALVPVRCPQCRGTQKTAVDVTRFRCHTCERAWRWAICLGCDDVAFTVERQESWRCQCGHFSRSWWRTDTAARDAPIVVSRRLDLAAKAEKERVRAGMRKRRWKLVAGAGAGLVSVLAFVGIVRASEPTVATGNAQTCRLFEDFRTDLGSGTLGAGDLEERLEELLVASDGADAAIRDRVVDLAAARQPSRAAFLVASTGLADACTAFERSR